MQAAEHTFGSKVLPHPPGSIGGVACKGAGAHFGTELLVSTAAGAARSCHPRIEATPRDTERLAHPQHWPYPSVLRDEAGLHVDSFAHYAAAFFRMSRSALRS